MSERDDWDGDRWRGEEKWQLNPNFGLVSQYGRPLPCAQFRFRRVKPNDVRYEFTNDATRVIIETIKQAQRA